MPRLILFDISRLLRPSRRSIYMGYVDGLGRLPCEAQPDLGLRGDLLLTRASAKTGHHVAARHTRDKQKLLAVLSSIVTRRGFPPLTWDKRDVS